MIDRLLQKKNLLLLGAVAAVLHAALGTLMYLMDVQALKIADGILLGLLAAAGVACLAREGKPQGMSAAHVLLAVSLVWYVVCCLSMTIRFDNDWVSYNSEPLLNTAVSFLLIFPLGCTLVREKRTFPFRLIAHIVLFSWSVLIAYFLLRVSQGQAIPTLTGGAVIMQDDSLLLNCNRNTTGVIEMVSFLGCVMMLLASRPYALKGAYGLAALVHYAALALSNSRSAFFATLPACAGMVGVAVFLALKNRGRSVRLASAILAALASGAAFYLLRGALFGMFTQSGAASSTAGAAAARELIAADTGTLNSRTYIWQAAWKGIVSSPRTFFFGVTPPSVPSMVEQMSDGRYNMYTHNQLIEIAAATGIPGLCLFLAWFVIILRDMFRLVFVQKNRTALLAVPIAVLALFVANMAEATLLYYPFISGYVFFLLCGLLHGAVRPSFDKKPPSRQTRRKAARSK